MKKQMKYGLAAVLLGLAGGKAVARGPKKEKKKNGEGKRA